MGNYKFQKTKTKTWQQCNMNKCNKKYKKNKSIDVNNE